MSESEAAGKLIKMPGMVEAEPTKPLHTCGVSRLEEKFFRKLLDIVELRIAKSPIAQSIKNILLLAFCGCEII